jgi:hypothetical protein
MIKNQIYRLQHHLKVIPSQQQTQRTRRKLSTPPASGGNLNKMSAPSFENRRTNCGEFKVPDHHDVQERSRQ